MTASTAPQLHRARARQRRQILLGVLVASLIWITCDAKPSGKTAAKALVKEGRALEERGMVGAALGKYEEAVAAHPESAPGRLALGTLLGLEGKVERAVEHLEHAIRLKPVSPAGYINMGSVLYDAGRYQQAVQTYQQGIQAVQDGSRDGDNRASEGLAALRRNAAEAYRASGNMAGALTVMESEWGSDIAECTDIIDLRVSNPGSFGSEQDQLVASSFAACNRACRQAGISIRVIEATGTSAVRKLVEHNLGTEALLTLRELMQATKLAFTPWLLLLGSLFEMAVAGNPGLENAVGGRVRELRRDGGDFKRWFDLGLELDHLGLPSHSVIAFEAAHAINPRVHSAAYQVGYAYYRMHGFFDKARKYFQLSLELDEGGIDADNKAATHNALAACWVMTHVNITQGIHHYRESLKAKWNQAAFTNLIHSLVRVCDWRSGLGNLLEELQSALATGKISGAGAWTALAYPLDNKVKVVINKKEWESVRRSAEGPAESFRQAPLAPVDEGGRLKLMYVSYDWGVHPVGVLMQNVPQLHDRERFHTSVVFLNGQDTSSERARVVRGADLIVEASQLDTTTLAQQINSMGIHVLVDLQGYTQGARTELFAMRAARIQVHYLGFPATMGGDVYSHIIGDRVTNPPELSHMFTERIATVPETYMVSDYQQSSRQELLVDKESLAETHSIRSQLDGAGSELGPDGHSFVFCNFNHLHKLDQGTFKLWGKILKKAPHARLWLLRYPEEAEIFLTKEAERAGLGGRVVFTSKISSMHMVVKQVCSVFLDTRHYSAHVSALDSVWGAQVPILTVPGDSMTSRGSSSLMAAIGLPWLVARDNDEYIELGLRFARDPPFYKKVRDLVKVRRLTSGAFDTRRFVRGFEDTVLAIYDTTNKESWRRKYVGDSAKNAMNIIGNHA